MFTRKKPKMPRAAKIKTVIVDDEPLARKRIAQLLAKETDIRLIAESGDRLAAISSINEC
jgi:chemotaxis response regulator CheB